MYRRIVILYTLYYYHIETNTHNKLYNQNCRVEEIYDMQTRKTLLWLDISALEYVTDRCYCLNIVPHCKHTTHVPPVSKLLFQHV